MAIIVLLTEQRTEQGESKTKKQKAKIVEPELIYIACC
jgi:hypothetical protein